MRNISICCLQSIPSAHPTTTSCGPLSCVPPARLEMYRKRFQEISPTRIVEFLVLDREFPRAIHYCVNAAEESLRAISGTRLERFEIPRSNSWGGYRQT